MSTSTFTFGQSHEHHLFNIRFDKNTQVTITSSVTPRDVMISLFGLKWSMEYEVLSRPDLFPHVVHIGHDETRYKDYTSTTFHIREYNRV